MKSSDNNVITIIRLRPIVGMNISYHQLIDVMKRISEDVRLRSSNGVL